MIQCAYQSVPGEDDIETQISKLQKQIEELEYEKTLREGSDNTYSSSGDMWNDMMKLRSLYQKLEESEADR